MDQVDGVDGEIFDTPSLQVVTRWGLAAGTRPGSCSSPGENGRKDHAEHPGNCGVGWVPSAQAQTDSCTSGRFSVVFSKENPRVTMATYSLANERLRALEDIEREIGAILPECRFRDTKTEGRDRLHMRGPSWVGRDPNWVWGGGAGPGAGLYWRSSDSPARSPLRQVP